MIILFNVVLFLEFLFQGYCVSLFFSSVMKERRVALSPVLLFLSASVIEFFCYRLIAVTVLNIVLFVVLTFIASIISYKTNPVLCFLYALINAGIFAMIELVSIPIVNVAFSENYLQTHSLEGELLSSTITKLIFFIICQSIKHIAVKDILVTKSVWIFIIPLLTIVCELLLPALTNRTDEMSNNLLILVYSVCMLIMNLTAFGVYERYTKSANENQRLMLLEQKNDLDYEHFKLLQMDYNNTRAIIHDMKHHINAIYTFVDQNDYEALKKYLSSLSHQNPESEIQNYTGNKIIDIIIYQKSEICCKYSIEFKFRANNVTLSFVDEADICCILSNLLDNAIEAAQKSKNKMIEVVFYSNENKTLFFIEITNSCDKSPVIRKDILLTDKSDKKLHGVGIYSVKRTLKKYHGFLNYSYDSESRVFKTTVTIENQ